MRCRPPHGAGAVGGRRGARRTALITMLALVAALPATVVQMPVAASPAQEYTGPYFGDGNFPPGCIRDPSSSNPDNVCYHLKTDLSALDSPEVDVLVLVPVSPTTERDMRIMRQTVEMWEGGIDYLASQMGLDWLADGMDFHVTLHAVDPLGEGGEFTTYPIVDPEIVVVATNPVGVAAGISPDPVLFTTDLAAELVTDVGDANSVPCHGVANPFDFEYWERLPGFDNHHEDRSGTYVEDCGGEGGNICFAVNIGADPAPDLVGDGTITAVYPKPLFDLVAHEFGHCLSLGHVGDGSETVKWGPVPYTDIMSYSPEPRGLTKCLSTLDVEGVAVRMSSYLDTNDDGAVDQADRLQANDQITRLDSLDTRPKPFQVQHPHDHLYASGTGSPLDCPQPDVGLVASGRTDWTPTPVDTAAAELSVTGPADRAVSADGTFDVAGVVERHSLFDASKPSTGSHDDPDNDAGSASTEILGLDVAVTSTDLEATIRVAALPAQTSLGVNTKYSLVVGHEKTDSFMGGVVGSDSLVGHPPVTGPFGSSTWDRQSNTVTFRISLGDLARLGLAPPYYVSSETSIGTPSTTIVDDRAPDTGHRGVGVAPPKKGGGTAPIKEHVHVYVDGALVGSEAVDTAGGGTGSFSVPVVVAEGAHEMRVVWEDSGEVLATRTFTVARGPDRDGDHVGDDDDNCVDRPNPDQANMDRDEKGDVCDPDMDGDSYSNAMENALGTDPADPTSYPGSG